MEARACTMRDQIVWEKEDGVGVLFETTDGTECKELHGQQNLAVSV